MISKGEGARVWDQQGRVYRLLVVSLWAVWVTVTQQWKLPDYENEANKIWHLSNVMTNEPALRLAKEANRRMFCRKVFFANSGAEANEAALKLARRWAADVHGPEKSEISFAFKQGFHGRTFSLP